MHSNKTNFAELKYLYQIYFLQKAFNKMKVIFNLFCFLFLSDFPLLPSAHFARRPGLKWPLTPQLGRLPTPSQWRQLMSNRSEEEDWKDAHKAYQSLKSIRKAPSETLALIDR